MRAMNVNTANLNRVILEKMPVELLLYNMSQASNYWGIPDDVIPKRKRGVSQRLFGI
jgi:DNA (cytosine-5)-methyltransferase 1